MIKLHKIIIITILIVLFGKYNAQKVGLVLSGGGASGLAHIGVIKALEENNIPIDYITGTSAGALVGSLYAGGYSPQEMESLVDSDLFVKMAYGEIDNNLNYYYKKEYKDPSMLKIWLEKEFSISKSIPTSLINSAPLDYELMTFFSDISKYSDYNFDNLFIPFRCLASDVNTKKSVIFQKGHINQAVRASMTFPGYLRPIKVDGKLMFDGGLYNNFPSDIMYNDFYPDIIIGVNLSDSVAPPDEDDVLSQLKSMVINRSNVNIICDNGILISPNVTIGGFDFESAKIAIKQGYEATINSMDSIKKQITRRVKKDNISEKRKIFKQNVLKNSTNKINMITISGVSNNQAKYIKNALIHKNEIEIDFNTLKDRFFKLLADENIKSLYPLAVFNSQSKKYEVKIDVVPQKPFAVKFGGIFSSRPINTGYFGAEYLKLGKVGIKAKGDIHFGKYYGSTGLSLKTYMNTRIPFYVNIYGVLNNWDYFKSFTTFFDAVKPSYIIQRESFYGSEVGIPLGKQFKLKGGISNGINNDKYYQTNNFSASDTSDVTTLNAKVNYINLSTSTLNKKAYPTEGREFNFNIKYIDGLENYYPGSTSSLYNIVAYEPIYALWLKANYQQYLNIHKNIKLGIDMEIVNSWYNNFFSNYTSTILNSPIYQPFAESKTHFHREYASHGYIGSGIKLITNIRPNISLRGELYIYRPSVIIEKTNLNLAKYNYNIALNNLRYQATTKLVINSPIGPIALSANYYDAQQNSPWNFSINYGYILFNKRFIK